MAVREVDDAAAAVDELVGLGVAAVAGEYHSVVARAAARADALGVPFLSSARPRCSTRSPRSRRSGSCLTSAQSRSWRTYAGAGGYQYPSMMSPAVGLCRAHHGPPGHDVADEATRRLALKLVERVPADPDVHLTCGVR